MPRSILMLCARGVVIDQRTNNVSVFNILEEMTPESLPLLVTEMMLFNLLAKEEDDPEVVNFRLEVSIADETLLEETVSTDFAGKTRNRNVVSIRRLVLEQPGLLTFSWQYDGDELARYQIQINPPRSKANMDPEETELHESSGEA